MTCKYTQGCCRHIHLFWSGTIQTTFTGQQIQLSVEKAPLSVLLLRIMDCWLLSLRASIECTKLQKHELQWCCSMHLYTNGLKSVSVKNGPKE